MASTILRLFYVSHRIDDAPQRRDLAVAIDHQCPPGKRHTTLQIDPFSVSIQKRFSVGGTCGANLAAITDGVCLSRSRFRQILGIPSTRAMILITRRSLGS